MLNFLVYKHIFPNGKIYIGITSRSIAERRSSGYKHNLHLHNAIRKYGWKCIISEILFSELTEEEAKQKEIELIAEYDACNPQKGYNISSGGESHAGCHFNHSDETRNKISMNNARYWAGTNGARFGMTRLTQSDIEFIKANYKRYSKDMGLEYFAKKFNVSCTVISRVVNGKYCGDKNIGGGAVC